MLRWKLFRSRWLTIAWFVMMCVLFFLPGADLPQAGWMDQIRIDKLFHVGLFAVFVFLWYSSFPSEWKYYGITVLALAIAYGFAVEIIQLLWIPNRSFDLFDVAADAAGSVLGWWVWRRVYKEKLYKQKGI